MTVVGRVDWVPVVINVTLLYHIVGTESPRPVGQRVCSLYTFFWFHNMATVSAVERKLTRLREAAIGRKLNTAH